MLRGAAGKKGAFCVTEGGSRCHDERVILRGVGRSPAIAVRAGEERALPLERIDANPCPRGCPRSDPLKLGHVPPTMVLTEVTITAAHIRVRPDVRMNPLPREVSVEGWRKHRSKATARADGRRARAARRVGRCHMGSLGGGLAGKNEWRPPARSALGY